MHDRSGGVAADWCRVSRRPHPALRRMVLGDYGGFNAVIRRAAPWLIPASSAVTLNIKVGEPVTGVPNAYLAGPGGPYWVAEPTLPARPLSWVGVRLTPRGAGRVLDLPVSEVAGQPVELGELFGETGRVVADQ